MSNQAIITLASCQRKCLLVAMEIHCYTSPKSMVEHWWKRRANSVIHGWPPFSMTAPWGSSPEETSGQSRADFCWDVYGISGTGIRRLYFSEVFAVNLKLQAIVFPPQPATAVTLKHLKRLWAPIPSVCKFSPGCLGSLSVPFPCKEDLHSIAGSVVPAIHPPSPRPVKVTTFDLRQLLVQLWKAPHQAERIYQKHQETRTWKHL